MHWPMTLHWHDVTPTYDVIKMCSCCRQKASADLNKESAFYLDWTSVICNRACVTWTDRPAAVQWIAWRSPEKRPWLTRCCCWWHHSWLGRAQKHYQATGWCRWTLGAATRPCPANNRCASRHHISLSWCCHNTNLLPIYCNNKVNPVRNKIDLINM